ncbi:MAG TPA: MAPEG family protein [Solimonas sp.]|nr:MAPEG family protein [Solimonas sp.]
MTGMTALLLFTLWTLVLAFTYVGYRVGLVLLMKKKANSWTRGLPTDDPGVITRAHHAHLNCVENLPVFAAIVLAAAALGRNEVVDGLAQWVLYARVAQSLVHLSGISHWQVFIRANLYVVQVALFVWMIWGLLAS